MRQNAIQNAISAEECFHFLFLCPQLLALREENGWHCLRWYRAFISVHTYLYIWHWLLCQIIIIIIESHGPESPLSWYFHQLNKRWRVHEEKVCFKLCVPALILFSILPFCYCHWAIDYHILCIYMTRTTSTSQ